MNQATFPGTYLTHRYILAVQYAVHLHIADVRKGTTIPYATHVLQVSGLVLEFGGTEDEAIGGLLHDAAEDAGGEPILAYVLAEFGPSVEQIVRENSDSITESKAFKAPWRERKEKYLSEIKHKSPSALLVSVCDKIHNVRALNHESRTQGEAHWTRFNAPKDELVWYYQSLVTGFEARIADEPRIGPATKLLREEVGHLSSVHF